MQISSWFCAVPQYVYVSLDILRIVFLNQAHAGLWLACTWFLKIDPVRIAGMRVFVCVCLRPRLLITSGVM